MIAKYHELDKDWLLYCNLILGDYEPFRKKDLVERN